MERCISCEFHLKQSVNHKMKDSIQKTVRSSENLTRNMLESQTEIQFKTAVTNIESFITEKRTKFIE